MPVYTFPLGGKSGVIGDSRALTRVGTVSLSSGPWFGVGKACFTFSLTELFWNAFGEVAPSVLLLVERKVLGGETKAVMRAQSAETDFQRHLSNLLEASGQRRGRTHLSRDFQKRSWRLSFIYLCVRILQSEELRGVSNQKCRAVIPGPCGAGREVQAAVSHSITSPMPDLLFPRRGNIL